MVTRTYYFDDYNVAEAFETNPGQMVDGSIETTGSTITNEDVQLCDSNTCSGANLGTISKVEIRAYGNSSASNTTWLRPVFTGGDGDNHNSGLGDSGEWTEWIDITNDTNAPTPWTWTDVSNLDFDVEFAKTEIGGTSIGKIEIRVTYEASANANSLFLF